MMQSRSLGLAVAATVLAAIPTSAGIAASTGADTSARATKTCPGGLPQGAEKRKLDPAAFSTRIDNPYWPMKPGRTWVYRETDGKGGVAKVVVRVTNKTKVLVNGVTARVVTDVVTEDGKPVEVTEDWYAQDRQGNLWYMGEKTAEYENGKVVSTHGSWEAGVDGAEPGIAVPAEPRPGVCYRQEYYRGEAEDQAMVLSTDEQATVPTGHYRNALLTRDTTPLTPRISEYKLYARGVGPVLILSVSGTSGGREELVRVSNAG